MIKDVGSKREHLELLGLNVRTVHPFMISDMGDNPTAGGAGDVTWTLREILNRSEFGSDTGPSLIYASIPGPEFVTKAVEAGVGGRVSSLAGAATDARYAPPIELTGTIEAIEHGDVNAETEVVVKVGSVHVIVTKKRKPYHHESDFTRLGLSPARHPRRSPARRGVLRYKVCVSSTVSSGARAGRRHLVLTSKG